LLSGCATHKQRVVDSVITINSDLFPTEFTREQYYEEMANAYSAEGQAEKAVDYYRLALLHNPNQLSARIGLSDVYRKLQKDHLASYELSEVLRVEPRNKLALLKMGDLYLSTGIYSKAREAFVEVLNIDDRYEDARWSLYYIYKLEKNYTEAKKIINTIEMTEKNKAELYFEKSLVAKFYEKFDEYSNFLNKAYKLDPHNRKYTLELTQHSLKNDEFERATEILSNYTQTHDFDMEISQNLAFVALRSENYDLVLSELDKQRSWVSDPYKVDMKKAHIYFLSSDIEQAEKLYREVLAVRPQFDEARFYLAQIYLYKNRMSEAQVVLDSLRPSSEYFAEAQVRMAYFERQNGHPDTAINRIRVAHLQRPDQLAIYKAYANFLIEAKRYVETVALLEKGIGFFPNDEELRVKVAFVHYRLRNQRSFKKHIEIALQINPNSAEIYATLTELWYLKKKNVQETEYFANKALLYKTKNKNVKPLLAWALLAQDRSTEAVALFEEFYEENPNEEYYAEALAQVYRRADVVMKAQQMNQLAFKLRNDNSLKSGLILDSQNKSIDALQPNSSPVRLPASLENE
jgi:tetratricopeptide (TPR) repeat protein